MYARIINHIKTYNSKRTTGKEKVGEIEQQDIQLMKQKGHRQKLFQSSG